MLAYPDIIGRLQGRNNRIYQGHHDLFAGVYRTTK